jgi:hypothetical protein
MSAAIYSGACTRPLCKKNKKNPNDPTKNEPVEKNTRHQSVQSVTLAN